MRRKTRTQVPPRFLTKQHHNAHEERVYEAARSHVIAHGKPPSARHLADLLAMNYATVWRHLEDLERKGRIKRTILGRLTIHMDFPEHP
jgi:DNA-binding MarR family transcriptional regulator